MSECCLCRVPISCGGPGVAEKGISSMQEGLPAISVLVLNFNGLKHLEPCFSSLQQLEYPADKLELILVDNHSSDGSVEFMQTHFPGVKIIRHPQNYGFSKGNN